MGDKSAIEWTDATWNPIVGCSIVSPGCTNCYAMKTAGARTKHTAKYQGLTKPSKAGPVWTGEVRFWEKALLDPLKWRDPRRVFVNSMGDLFHEDVPDEWIDRCFAVMALAPQHTFQVLTKRPDRMRDYLRAAESMPADRMALSRVADLVESMRTDNRAVGPLPHLDGGERWWPLANVWLGVSCEDQRRADERIPVLLDTPAAVRFISAEPLLGPINLRPFLRLNPFEEDRSEYGGDPREAVLDWVIVGGESGPGARQMHPDWPRLLRDQCAHAGVSFFFKQWGQWRPLGPIFHDDDTYCDDIINADEGRSEIIDGRGRVWREGDGQPTNDAWMMERVGKAGAGRILDGRTWDQYPEARP